MRIVYILITFFLILCVFFARWYLCEVRGICDLAAVVEVLAMTLMALLLGFAGSWLLSEKTFRAVRGQLGRAEHSNALLQDQLQTVEKENEIIRRHLGDWQREVSDLAQKKRVTEPLLLQAQNQVTFLQQELQTYQRRYDNLKMESDSVRDLAERLKTELAEERLRAAATPMTNVKEKPAPPSSPPRSRFTPSTWQTKNDLTKINGIGPVIQRRLNEIGIYSFQQISELTPEMIDRIATAIKFFPDRIGRDNWIGQAAALMKGQKK
jgi:predicted flap endonuclease-1-like 5' DNA nuclease